MKERQENDLVQSITVAFFFFTHSISLRFSSFPVYHILAFDIDQNEEEEKKRRQSLYV